MHATYFACRGYRDREAFASPSYRIEARPSNVDGGVGLAT